MSRFVVSIVIPVYNSRLYIDECLCSVVQLGDDVEIIVVDDGSSDGSAEICDFYAMKHKSMKVIHKKNEGVSIARNVGVSEANGKWITFVDADDIVNVKAYGNVLNLLRNSDADVVYSSYRLIDENGAEKKRFVYKDGNKNRSAILRQILKYEINTSVWANFYRCKLFSGKIEFSQKLKVGEDFLFNFELFWFNKNLIAEKTSLITYNYRLNPSSTMRTMDKRVSYAKLNEVLIGYEEYEEYENFEAEIAYHILLTTLISVKESILSHQFIGYHKDTEFISIFRKYGSVGGVFFEKEDRELIMLLSSEFPLFAEYYIRFKQRCKELRFYIRNIVKG